MMTDQDIKAIINKISYFVYDENNNVLGTITVLLDDPENRVVLFDVCSVGEFAEDENEKIEMRSASFEIQDLKRIVDIMEHLEKTPLEKLVEVLP
ncbi:MAG: hypothetical protein QXZ28_03310 [Candidatus Methanomethylicaceae archaeon]